MRPPAPTPPAPFTRVIRGGLEDIAPLTEQLHAWAQAAGAPPHALASIALALDELISNIVTHGYAGEPGEVQVHAVIEPGQLTLTLTDRAFAFNPLDSPEPDTSLGLEQREPGGLGVHFVPRTADAPSYRRIEDDAGGANELRLTKRFEPPKRTPD